jgi:hypothetical protein
MPLSLALPEPAACYPTPKLAEYAAVVTLLVTCDATPIALPANPTSIAGRSKNRHSHAACRDERVWSGRLNEEPLALTERGHPWALRLVNLEVHQASLAITAIAGSAKVPVKSGLPGGGSGRIR